MKMSKYLLLFVIVSLISYVIIHIKKIKDIGYNDEQEWSIIVSLLMGMAVSYYTYLFNNFFDKIN